MTFRNLARIVWCGDWHRLCLLPCMEWPVTLDRRNFYYIVLLIASDSIFVRAFIVVAPPQPPSPLPLHRNNSEKTQNK